MGRETEAAVVAASSELIEIAESVAELPAQSERWSIRRMLAVSAVISMGLWALIAFVVMAIAN